MGCEERIWVKKEGEMWKKRSETEEKEKEAATHGQSAREHPRVGLGSSSATTTLSTPSKLIVFPEDPGMRRTKHVKCVHPRQLALGKGRGWDNAWRADERANRRRKQK